MKRLIQEGLVFFIYLLLFETNILKSNRTKQKEQNIKIESSDVMKIVAYCRVSPEKEA